MSKISVVIPVYNTEKYLRQCLDSVVNQTFKDIEIICVDDGSTDNSLEILKEYQKNDSRLIILQQNHIGAGEARNKGIEVAKGKYIGFLDSDDWFEPDMLEKMHQRATKFDADMVVCSSKNYDIETNTFINPSEYYPINLEMVPLETPFNYKDCPDYIFNIFGVEPWRHLYLSDIIRKNNLKFQNLESCNDMAFGMISRVCAKRIIIFDEKLVVHRINHNNSITLNRWNFSINSIKSSMFIKDFLIKNNLYSKLEKTFLKHAFGSCRYETSKCNEKQYNKFLKELKEFLPDSWHKFLPVLKKDYVILDYLYQHIGENKVMLWGASNFIKDILSKEKTIKPNILGFVDKNFEMQGTMCGNYKIYPPEALNELKPDAVVLTVLNNNETIYAELEKEFREKYKSIMLLDNIFSEKIWRLE